MYDKILVAVDHSEISDRAVLVARDLAVLSKGEVKLTWADGGYAGKLVTWAKTRIKLTVQIVKRSDDLHTFKVLPRRWMVERTLSWITRHRRTVRDYERLAAHHETYVYWSMIIVMTRRLARQRTTVQPQAA